MKSGQIMEISGTQVLYKQSNGLATYECDKLQKEQNGHQALVSQSSILVATLYM